MEEAGEAVVVVKEEAEMIAIVGELLLDKMMLLLAIVSDQEMTGSKGMMIEMKLQKAVLGDLAERAMKMAHQVVEVSNLKKVNPVVVEPRMMNGQQFPIVAK